MGLELCSVPQAVELMKSYRGNWFGPPLAMFRGKILDGRRREEAWTLLGKPYPRPFVPLEGERAAVRWLIAAGHIERALLLIPHTSGRGGLDRVDLARFCLTPSEEAQLLATHRTQPSKPRPAPRRAIAVVNALRNLYTRALEDGEAITTHDLRDALGEWL